jgi:hypothetical protein
MALAGDVLIVRVGPCIAQRQAMARRWSGAARGQPRLRQRESGVPVRVPGRSTTEGVMRGLPRLIVLGAALGLIVWFLFRLSPDRPTRVQAPAATSGQDARETPEATPRTPEDRAIWRDTIDRRLR